MFETLAWWKPIFLLIHAIGFILGFGGAVIADSLFFKFLKDLRISKLEKQVLGHLSNVVVYGLTILFVSGILLFLTDPQTYLHSSKFLTKMIIVYIIAFNGWLLHRRVSPSLMHIEWHKGTYAKKRPVRKLAFALGSISMTSWTCALILGYLRSIPFTVAQALGCYVLIIGCAVAVSQILEHALSHYMDKKTS